MLFLAVVVLAVGFLLAGFLSTKDMQFLTFLGWCFLGLLALIPFVQLLLR